MPESERQPFARIEMSEELALLAALQADIARRLKPVCSGMDDCAFEALVRDIAAMKLKYREESDLPGSLRTELHGLLSKDSEKPT